MRKNVVAIDNILWGKKWENLVGEGVKATNKKRKRKRKQWVDLAAL